MRNKHIPLKATLLALALAGSVMQAQAASATGTVTATFMAQPVGTCSVTPAAAMITLPDATVGQTLAAYLTANAPTPGVAAVGSTSATLNQTLNLVCGSTVSILGVSIVPTTPDASFPSWGRLTDSAATKAFGALGTGAELVSINGAATLYSFVAATAAAAAPAAYSAAFNVGTTVVPVVWRPVLASVGTAAPFAAPASGTGYTGAYTVTINY